MSAPLLAGVDVGGTTTRVVLCTTDLATLAEAETATPASRGGEVMIGAAALLEQLCAELGVLPQAIGVGAAGVIDPATGRVVASSDSFAGWTGVDVAAGLGAQFGVPAVVDNDVNAFLRGEIIAGAAAGHRDVLGIALGTGVGGALWLDGRLHAGHHGAAGELGHMPGFGSLPCTCGGRGHLETLAGGRAVARRYAHATGERVDSVEVARRARSGDAVAAEVFAAAGNAVGRAALMTCAIVDVDAVVVGGGVAAAWDLLEPALLLAIDDEPPVSGYRPVLRRSALGADAVALGAAASARDRLSTAVDSVR